MTPRIAIVGEAPSRSSNPRKPFSGASGLVLARCAGLSGYEELAERAKLLNVLPRWPGEGYRGEKGSKFPIVEARERAKKLRKLLDMYPYVLLAGKRVARAFGYDAPPYFRVVATGDCPFPYAVDGGIALQRIFVVPHPSGCNHWWNHRHNRAVAEVFLSDVFASAGANEC